MGQSAWAGWISLKGTSGRGGWRWPELPMQLNNSKRLPRSPKEAWLSDGRQVLHVRPSRWDRWSQQLEDQLPGSSTAAGL